jgi:hypothetical protein
MVSETMREREQSCIANAGDLDFLFQLSPVLLLLLATGAMMVASSDRLRSRSRRVALTIAAGGVGGIIAFFLLNEYESVVMKSFEFFEKVSLDLGFPGMSPLGRYCSLYLVLPIHLVFIGMMFSAASMWWLGKNFTHNETSRRDDANLLNSDPIES